MHSVFCFAAAFSTLENRKAFAQPQFPTAASASESWWWPFGKKERAIFILFGPPGAGMWVIVEIMIYVGKREPYLRVLLAVSHKVRRMLMQTYKTRNWFRLQSFDNG